MGSGFLSWFGEMLLLSFTHPNVFTICDFGCFLGVKVFNRLQLSGSVFEGNVLCHVSCCFVPLISIFSCNDMSSLSCKTRFYLTFHLGLGCTHWQISFYPLSLLVDINMSRYKNVKGLNHVIKHQKILTFLKKEECHMAFLQKYN